MAKTHSQYVCQQCGYSQVGWAGKCSNCDTWGSLVETLVLNSSKQSGGKIHKVSRNAPVFLSSVTSQKTKRVATNISELDRALGGGIVPGQVILLAGEPGIGKSTLLLQVADSLKKVLYVSGEESVSQIAIRAQRLGIKSKELEILESTDVDEIESKDGVNLIIVDSIQTMTTTDLSGMAGSVGQVRECAARLVRLAKSSNTPIFIVGHVTKVGTVAGPSTLAHIVDTVLWFEGDKSTNLRLIRTVKNRFGSTDEVGIFQMEDKGLVSVADAGRLFVSENTQKVPGSAITSIMEGTRPILVEIQSLVVSSNLPYPRRVGQGIDAKRMEVILAVLIKHCKLNLMTSDVFVNVVGGITIKEPGADLAIALSIASTFFSKSLPIHNLTLGEVDLLGKVRAVNWETKRVKEASRLGFKNSITSKNEKDLNLIIRKLFK